MNSTFDLARRATKITVRHLDPVSDGAYFIGKRINELEAHLEVLDFQIKVTEDAFLPYFVGYKAALEADLRACKRILKKELQWRKELNLKIVNYLNNTVFLDDARIGKVFRSQFVYVNKIFSIHKKILDDLAKACRVKLQDEASLLEFVSKHKYDYTYLSNEEGWDYHPTEEELTYVAETTPRLKKSKSLDFSNLNYDVPNISLPEQQVINYAHIEFRSILKYMRLFNINNYWKLEHSIIANFKKFFLDTPAIEGYIPLDDLTPQNPEYCISEALDVLTELEDQLTAVKFKEGHHQMDDGSENLQPDKAGNVVLTESRDTDTAVANPIKLKTWNKRCTNEPAQSYTYMTDRWLLFKNFTWETTQKVNDDVIPSMMLPFDIVRAASKPCEVPNFVPFTVHRYSAPNFEIQVLANMQKFMTGQLLVAWLFEPDLDGSIKDRENIFNLSQTDHCIISAGANNEGKITVNFKNHNPYITNHNIAGWGQPLNMGRLYIKVLVPLRSTTSADSCEMSIYIRFFDCKFTGMVSGSLSSFKKVENPQMFTMNTAMKLLNTFASDLNRDLPPDTRPPNRYIPGNTSSWSAGDNTVTSTNPLRLDHRGQVPHPEISTDEMKVATLVQRPGLLTQFDWSSINKHGDNIWACPSGPIVDYSIYSSDPGSSDQLIAYRMPPIGIVSSCFAKYTGPYYLDFKLASNSFYTGRLMVAYVPGVLHTDNVTIEQAKCCPHIVFDLADGWEFKFEVPYISPAPWHERRYTGDYYGEQRLPLGSIFVFVVNKLNRPATVSDRITINVFQSAAPGFELAVPVNTNLGLINNRDVIGIHGDKIIADLGYFPYYSGGWHTFNSGNSYMFRYGPVSDHVSQFSFERPPIASWIYCNTADNSIKAFINGTAVKIHYAVPIMIDGYRYMVPMIDENAASKAARYLAKFNKNATDDIILPESYCISSANTSLNTYCTGNPLWTDTKVTDVGEHQINEFAPGSDTSPTGGSYYTFGEDFQDMKSYCRRYQIYKIVDISKKLTDDLISGIRIPIMYQGLKLNVGAVNHEYSVSNRGREGGIPLIAGGYRYARGSLRLRLVFDKVDDITIWVQHRPDKYYTGNEVSFFTTTKTDLDSVFNHNYATHIQNLGLNNIIEVEIPFYQSGVYGLLQNPLDSDHILLKDNLDIKGKLTLGDLIIGGIANKKKVFIGDFTCSIFYALGDDCRFYQYQGFPPVASLDQIHFQPLISDGFVRLGEHQGPDPCTSKKGFIEKKLDDATDKATDKIASSITERVDDTLKHIKTKISDFASTLKNNFMSKDTGTSLLLNFLFQILHIIVNPTPVTIAVSIAGFVTQLLSISFTYISKLIEVLKDWWNLSSKDKKNKPTANIGEIKPVEAKEGEHQADTPPAVVVDEKSFTDGAADFITLVWSLVSLQYNVKKHKLSKDTISEWVGSVSADFSKASNMYMKGLLFVKAVFSLLYKCIKYLFILITPKSWLGSTLKSQKAHIQLWCKEVMFLTDSANFDKIVNTVKYQDRVYAAALAGQHIACNTTDAKDGTASSAVRQLWRKIEDLKSTLVKMGKHPYIREEPFSLYVCGEKGIGKSRALEDLSIQYCKMHNIPTNGGIAYKFEPCNNFYNGCDKQPVFWCDDLWNLIDPESTRLQLNAIYSVCGCAPFNPPKARLEEKDLRYAPSLALWGSNYPDCSHVKDIACKEAVDRRVHLKVKAQLNSRCKSYGQATKIPVAILEKYEHIEYLVTPEVSDTTKTKIKFDTILTHYDFLKENGYAGPSEDRGLTHTELTQVLCVMSKRHREKELARLQRVIKEVESLSTTSIDESEETTPVTIGHVIQERIQKIHNHCKETIKEACDPKDALARFVERVKFFKISNPWKVSIPVQPITTLDMSDENILNSLAFHANEDKKKVKEGEHNAPDPEYERKVQAANNRLALKQNRSPKEKRTEDIKVLYEFKTAFDDKTFKHLIKQWSNLDYEMLDSTELRHRYTYASSKHTKKEMIDAIGSFHFCDHSKITAKSNFSSGVWRMGDMQECITDSPCPETTCVWRDPFYVSLVLEDFIYHHPWCEKLLRTTSRSELPRFYHRNNTWVNKMKSLVDIILHGVGCIFDCVGSVLSVLGKSLKFVLKTIFPILIPIFGLIAITQIKQEPVPVTVVSKIDNPQIGSSGDNIQPAKVSKLKPLAIKIGNHNVGNKIEDVIRLVKRNMVFLCSEGDMNIRARCLMLRGRQMLIIKHYDEAFMAMSEDTKYYLSRLMGYDHDKIPIDYRSLSSNIIWYGKGDSNLGLLELPVRVPPFKSIVKFIASQNAHTRVSDVGSLIQGDPIDYNYISFKRENITYVIRENGNMSEVVLDDIYSYKPSGRGMCGSILIDHKLNEPIIGIHVAGGNGEGTSEPLLKEMFDGEPPKFTSEVYEMPMEDYNFDIEDFDTSVFPMGFVPKEMTAFQSGRSRIVPSLIHNTLEVNSVVAPLSANDPRIEKGRSPMHEGCRKHGLITPQLNDKILQECYQDLSNKIVLNTKPIVQKQNLTLEQAICGDLNLSFVEPLKWNTSPGFPFTTTRPASISGKKYLFNLEETEQGFKLKGLKPELKKIFDVKMAMRVQNIRPFTIFVDCLKDSRISKSKLHIPGKTRIFSISPVDYTIAFRQYFGNFMASYQVARFDCEHAIGINVTSYEWSNLARKIQSKGKSIVIGDYSNFGPGLVLECAYYAFKIIFDWYDYHFGANPTFEQIRTIMMEEMLNSYHLMGDLVYQVSCGLPSGSPITAILNSLINCLYVRYAWKMIYLNTELESFKCFHDNCWLIVYGDDLMLNVSDLVKEDFNGESIQKIFKEWGITFTDALKVEPIRKFVNLTETSFLKASFITHPKRNGFYLCGLDKKSVEDISNWIEKCPQEKEATLINAEQCCDKAYGWGPKYHEEICNILKPAVKHHCKLNLIPRTWDELDRLYLS